MKPSFDDVVLGRRSIRGYKPDPAPKALIREVIEMAGAVVARPSFKAAGRSSS